MFLIKTLTLVALFIEFSLVKSERCGIQRIKTRELITRGYDTFAGQFPWHVAIFHRKSRISTDYACGGSLIASSFVITAGHCVKTEEGHEISVRRLVVYVGLHDRQHFDSNVKSHSVYEVHTVPQEDRWAKLKNDIALLELNGKVSFADYVQLICLNAVEVTSDELGTVVGWGRTEEEETSDILKTSSMPIVSTIDCLASDRAAFGATLDSGMLCAGYKNGTSVCNGDSGGGLVVRRCYLTECSWFLVGIVSFAASNEEGSCRSDGYGVFTKIKAYLPWISQITGLQLRRNEYHGKCGRRQDASARDRWPWHGTLHRTDWEYLDKDLNLTECCGVTILTDQFVITSVNLYDLYRLHPGKLAVRFGSPAIGFVDRYTQDLPVQEMFTTVEDESGPNDESWVILFKLQGHIQFTKYVQPICMWPEDSTRNSVGKVGFMVSYGLYNSGNRPQTVPMPIVSKTDCINDHRRLAKLYEDSHTFCAGTKNGTGPEALDFGGGLFIRNGNTWHLRGIFFEAVSIKGDKIGISKVNYVMFVDVIHFSKWITHIIDENS